MQGETKVVGLIVKSENLVLKPLKKGDYKSFLQFSKEYDNYAITIEEYLQLQASKEFLFFQSGKLSLYLFEKSGKDKFESGEIIGYAEITPQKDVHTVEVGYFIKESKRGKGYAKKILHMAIAMCVNMDFEIVVASVKCENKASVAVLKSQNFNFHPADNKELQAFLKIKGSNLPK